jgi:hypothetical protein
MFYLYTMRTEARRGTSLHVARQILVHVFKHKEQYKLLFLFQLPSMADIKQPARKQSPKFKKNAPLAHLTSTYFGLSSAELFVL